MSNDKTGVEIYDILALNNSFITNIFDQTDLSEGKFASLSNRSEADTLDVFRYLYIKLQRTDSKKLFEFGFLHDVGIFSDAAFEAADEWTKNGADIGVIGFPVPSLQFYVPKDDLKTLTVRHKWDIEALIDSVHQGSSVRPIGIGVTREWLEGTHQRSVGLQEILALKPKMDQAKEELAIKIAARLGWTPAGIESVYNRLQQYGHSKEAVLGLFAEPIRDVLKITQRAKSPKHF